MATRVGVDVGGTFTDLVYFDQQTGEVKVGKGSTVPAAPEEGVQEVVHRDLAADEISAARLFFHGTTVGINSLVERKGASVGILTTDGFRDVLETRRTDREEFYNMLWRAPEPLVRRRNRLGARERVRADGEILVELVEEDVSQAARIFEEAGVESVAVVFINSHANPQHEVRAGELLEQAGFSGEVSLSHQVTGEFREYERTSTTVIDAYVRPRVSRYLRALEEGVRGDGFGGDFFVTRSGGGSLPFREAEDRPFETIMSGPVAGAAGAAEMCRLMDLPLAVTADVGGTTFDTCMVVGGRPIVQFEGQVSGMPIQTTWIDVRSIGAGGGSIAFEDKGLLRVGPHSAGAVPGPVCYGLGGTEPTVTDAAATLGMLAFGQLAGGVSLDIDSARGAVEGLGGKLGLDVDRAAHGIINITTVAMANSIRAILEEVGENPAEASVIAFGGAGPLFATMIARELNATTVVIPPYAGNFSAWGLLLQEPSRAAARTVVTPLSRDGIASASTVMNGLAEKLSERKVKGSAIEGEEEQLAASLDLRYEGQEYFLTVDVPFDGTGIHADEASILANFEKDYEKRYGHTLTSPVEIVAARVSLTTPLPKSDLFNAPYPYSDAGERKSVNAFSFTSGGRQEFQVVNRDELAPGSREAGPMIVLEETATTYVDVGFTVETHESGSLVLHEG